MLIRTKRVQNNASGRVGCQFYSRYTGSIYYASVEQGAIVLRDWAGTERAREQQANPLVPLDLSADFASPGQVAVTVAGFEPNTNDSGMDTYIIAMPEG